MFRLTTHSRYAAAKRSFSSYTKSTSIIKKRSNNFGNSVSLQRLDIDVVPSVSYLNNGSFSGSQYMQNRCFFFSSGEDDDSNSNNNDDKKKKKGDKDIKDIDEDKDEDKKDEDNSKQDDDTTESTNSQDSDSPPSPTLNNSARYKTSDTRSNVLVPATRLGFGDQAPRYPHLTALPVTRGPVFPG